MNFKIFLYVAGTYGDGIGACAWAACDGWGDLVYGCIGTKAGPTRSADRMLLRATLEGLMRLPPESIVEIYQGWEPKERDNGDISVALYRLRQDRHLSVSIVTTLPIESDDLPKKPRELLGAVCAMADKAWEQEKQNQSKAE